MPTRLAFVFLMLAALSAPALAAQDPHGYAERIEAVQALGRRFPSFVQLKGFENRRLGVWAGIMLQTEWQRDSGRGRYHIWRDVNATLTLEPHAFALEYMEDPSAPAEASAYVRAHPTRDPAHAPITQADVCRAWRAFFAAHDAAAKRLESNNPLDRVRGRIEARVSVTRLLWKAHTAAVKHALWQNEAAFAAAEVPAEEARFWRNWVEFVYVMEKIGAPATDLLARPILDRIMPECSPLGEGGCAVGRQPVIAQAFLRLLMREKQRPAGEEAE